MTGVSHFLMVERPAEFDSLLIAFLEENELLEP
jgi:pimeloyl-ACP methyl ester carboxylesterase